MSFDKEKVKNIAHLARIEMEEETLEKLTPDFNAIMEWIEQLSEVDTKNVEPMTSSCEHKLPQMEDVVKQENNQEQVLKNAPETDENKEFFSVPKVVSE